MTEEIRTTLLEEIQEAKNLLNSCSITMEQLDGAGRKEEPREESSSLKSELFFEMEYIISELKGLDTRLACFTSHIGTLTK